MGIANDLCMEGHLKLHLQSFIKRVSIKKYRIFYGCPEMVLKRLVRTIEHPLCNEKLSTSMEEGEGGGYKA